jgi:hypothetical protein
MNNPEGSDINRTLADTHSPTLANSWGTPVALAMVTALVSVLNPTLLVFVPLAFMLVALPPRKALLMAIAIAVFISTFSSPTSGGLWWYGRGWALILSAWFILAIALMPAASTLSRSLAAVGASVVSVTLLFLMNRGGWYQLEWEIDGQLRKSAAEVVAVWGAQLKDKEWAGDLASAIYRFADFQAKVYPAAVSIASLTGLALAWWLWRRLSAREARPLGALRDFKFNDELIWLVVIGAALVALPLHGAATRTGANVLTFMAALYALRGLAVMVALFGAPSFIGALFGFVLFLMLYPIMMATTLVVGLTDTWLDLRARRLLRQDNEKH